MSLQLPEQLKNPYVLGGLALAFIVVLMLSKSNSSGTAGAQLDPNLALATKANVQLSTASLSNQIETNKAVQATTIASINASAADFKSLMATILQSNAALSVADQAAKSSATSMFSDSIAGFTAANRNAAAIVASNNQVILGTIQSNNAAVVSANNAQVQQNIAQINAVTQQNIAGYNAQVQLDKNATSTTNALIGVIPSVLGF